MCSLISHKKSLRATVNMENRVSYREKTQIRLPNYFYSKKTESFYISNGENYILMELIKFFGKDKITRITKLMCKINEINEINQNK